MNEDPEDLEILANMAAGLRKGFPGVDFTVISGIASLAVMDGNAGSGRADSIE